MDYGIDGVLSFNNKPLRLAVYLGAFVTLLSALYVVWVIGAAVVYGVDSPGYVTLISAVIGLGGMQLAFLGIVGEYIGRIYFETKRRPHYLVKESSGLQDRTDIARQVATPGTVAG
jgi:hypothetical protein